MLIIATSILFVKVFLLSTIYPTSAIFKNYFNQSFHCFNSDKLKDYARKEDINNIPNSMKKRKNYWTQII